MEPVIGLKNVPFRLEYLAFAQMAWKNGQTHILQRQVPHLVENEPHPYNSSIEYTPYMHRSESNVFGSAFFVKEWMAPEYAEYLEKNKRRIEKCWVCFMVKRYPHFEEHPPTPRPIRICGNNWQNWHNLCF